MHLSTTVIIIIITGLSVLVIQSRDLDPYIHKILHSVLLVKMVSFFILAMLVFLAISVIYTYGPSLTHKFRFVSTGSVFATIASVAATSVFFFFVARPPPPCVDVGAQTGRGTRAGSGLLRDRGGQQ